MRWLLTILFALSAFAQEGSIPIADLKREKPVDFANELMPVFRRSCLPCHNAADAKGDLVMETPAQILKGGESGKVVIPGKGAESILLQSSARMVKPFMPPKNNKANAPALTSEELGLLKLWIDQGATGTVAVLPPIQWKEFPASFNAIGAVAMSPDGQWLAASRGNQVDVYETARLEFAGTLVDPEIGAADRDMIGALAFSPDSKTIAVGAYRAIKFWTLAEPGLRKRDADTNEFDTKKFDLGQPVKHSAVSAERKRVAAAGGNVTKLWSMDDAKLIAELKGDHRLQQAAGAAQLTLNFAKSEVAFHKSSLEAAEKHLATETESLKKTTEAKAAAEKSLAEKADAQKKAAEGKVSADKGLADLKGSIAQATENKALSAKLNEAAAARAKATAETLGSANQILERAKGQKESAYAEVIDLAAAGKRPEATAAIDRALVVKLSFEHAESARAAAAKANNDSQEALKSAAENQTKADKVLADLQGQLKGAEEKQKASEKQLADADAALKAAENARNIANANFDGGTAVTKKAADSVGEWKSKFAAAQESEKKATEALEAANKRAAESEKEVVALAFEGPWLSARFADNTVHFYGAETGAAGPVREGEGLVFEGGAEWKFARRIGDGTDASPIVDRVLGLDFSPDGKLLASAGGVPTKAGEIKIWNAVDGAFVREIKDAHSDSVNCVKFSPDGKLLASGGADKLMKVFEVETGKFVRSFEGHTHHVLNVAWMRHQRTIASASADSTVKVWDFASGEQKRTIGGSGKEVTAFAYLDGSAEALLVSGDNQVRLIKEDGNGHKWFGGASGYTQAAAMTADAKYVAAGGTDSVLRIWNGQSGALLKALNPPERKEAAKLANSQANK